MLVVQYIAPTWIMPLFNKFKPLEEGELKSAILSCAKSIQFPLKNVYTMDGSKRSRKSNAFFTGFGKNKRIVLFDTLIQQHTVPELVAVLAHEMGHYKKKHILQGMLLGILQTGLMFFLLSFMISHQGLFEAFYMNHISVYAGLIFFGMLFAPLDFFIGILMQIRSRSNEYQADRFAVAATRNPGAMIDALKKLSVHNLSNLLPHPFYVFLNYSHPPVLKRIEAIQKIEINHLISTGSQA
jgi:STE24 endopeptidase